MSLRDLQNREGLQLEIRLVDAEVSSLMSVHHSGNEWQKAFPEFQDHFFLFPSLIQSVPNILHLKSATFHHSLAIFIWWLLPKERYK